MDATNFFFIAFIGMILYVVLTRWIFRIDEQVKNQKIIIDMLGQILLEKGLSVEEVRAILAKHEKK